MDVNKGISLLGDSGEMLSEAKSASTFLDYFASVFSKPVNRGTYIEPAVNHTINHLDDIVIIEEMVIQQLEFLNVTKSPGPDSIHPKLLRKYSKFFYKPLYILFTQSFMHGILPCSWKLANIIPIHKKGPDRMLEIMDQFL